MTLMICLHKYTIPVVFRIGPNQTNTPFMHGNFLTNCMGKNKVLADKKELHIVTLAPILEAIVFILFNGNGTEYRSTCKILIFC